VILLSRELNHINREAVVYVRSHLYNNLEATKDIIIQQIDNGWPIPCLTLLHQHPSMEDYVWHWYIINGYEQFDNTLMVKTVTYGTWRWFDLATLWDTGKSPKGGLIIFS
jgi:hypothetical protein